MCWPAGSAAAISISSASSSRVERAMPRRLLIVFTDADLKAPQTLSAPFYHAALAAAMDYEVDVFCSGAAARLMVKGVAESVAVTAKDAKTVYDWIKQAHDQGARFWTCSTNLELIGASE